MPETSDVNKSKYLYCFYSKRWSIFIILLLIFFLYNMFNHNFWNYWGIPHIEPTFADMHAILSASDAHQDGFNVFLKNPYDVQNRVHIYSRMWLWIGNFGLSRNDNTLLGGLLVSLFLLVAISLLRPRDLKEFLVALMILFSPAIMLGVERANNDLVIFIILVSAIHCLYINMRYADFLSYLLILFASFLKFYPLVSFSIFIRHIKENPKFWRTVFLVTLAWSIYFLLTYDDFVVLQKTVIQPYARGTFGASILLCWLSMQWPANKIIYFSAVSLLFIISFFLSGKYVITQKEVSSRDIVFFMMGSSCLLFCFFAFTNFDYRCIFFIPTMPYFFEQLKNKETPLLTRRLIHIFFLFLFVVLWNELLLGNMELLVKTMNIEYMKKKLIFSFFLFEHLCSWIVMTILLLFAIEIFKTAVYEKAQYVLSKIVP